jgi:GxxExxY protein
VLEFGIKKISAATVIRCALQKSKGWSVRSLMIAFDSVVVDTKVIERITDHERGLMLNYLRITGLRVGVILNFKHRKLEWERIAL